MQRIFTCLLIVISSSVQAQLNDYGILQDFIKKSGDSLLNKYDLPGIFVAISNAGKREYFDFGHADPDTKARFDSTTIFEAGSITKTFTAFILLSVLKEKKIVDTNAIRPYLPVHLHDNKSISSITFRQLLNHTSGLPRIPSNLDVSAGNMLPYNNYDSAKLFTYLASLKVEPTSVSNYSNTGFGLAGYISSVITGLDFDQLLDRYIFKPFNIAIDTSGAEKSKGYFGRQVAEYWDMNILAGAGNLKINASGLLAYLQALSNPPGSLTDIVSYMLTPTIPLSKSADVCLGWISLHKGKLPVYWHNGGTYGFSTFAAFTQGTGNAVVVVVNKFNVNSLSDRLGFQIMELLNHE